MFSEKFEHEYQSIDISKEMIILCDGSKVRMYNLKGILKFDGIIGEGAVKNVFQMSSKRYMVISENGIHTISLKIVRVQMKLVMRNNFGNSCYVYF